MNKPRSHAQTASGFLRNRRLWWCLAGFLSVACGPEENTTEPRKRSSEPETKNPNLVAFQLGKYSLSSSPATLSKAIISGGDSSAGVARLLLDMRDSPDWEKKVREFCAGGETGIPWGEVCQNNRKEAWRFILSIEDEALRLVLSEKFRDALTPAEFSWWLTELRNSGSNVLQQRLATGIELARLATRQELAQLVNDPEPWVSEGAARGLAVRLASKTDWLEQALKLTPSLAEDAKQFFVDRVFTEAAKERPGDWPLSGPKVDEICAFARVHLKSEQASLLIGRELHRFATDHPVEALQQVLDTSFPDQLLAARSMFGTWVSSNPTAAMQYLATVGRGPFKDELISAAISAGRVDSSPEALNHWISQMSNAELAAKARKQLGL